MPSLVIIDTNVLVSGVIISESPPGKIIDAWHDGKLEIILSESILREVEDVLKRPYFVKKTGWSLEKVQDYIDSLRIAALVVSGKQKVRVCRDPKDDMIFSCAIEAKADYIVSGDKDVLEIGTYKGIIVLTPRDFVEKVLR